MFYLLIISCIYSAFLFLFSFFVIFVGEMRVAEEATAVRLIKDIVNVTFAFPVLA